MSTSDSGVKQERRRSRRFELALPIYVSQYGSSQFTAGETINVSSSGVLFHLRETLPVGQQMRWELHLLGDEDVGMERTRLDCVGTVVREQQSDGGCAYAAKLGRYQFVGPRPQGSKGGKPRSLQLGALANLREI